MKTSDIFREVCKRMPENTSGITIMWTPDEDNEVEFNSWDFAIATELDYDTDGVRAAFYIRTFVHYTLIPIGIMETFEKSDKAMEMMGITIAKFMITFDKYLEEVAK